MFDDPMDSQLLSQFSQNEFTAKDNGSCFGSACLGSCPAPGIGRTLSKPHTPRRWFGQKTIEANVVCVFVVSAVVDDHSVGRVEGVR